MARYTVGLALVVIAAALTTGCEKEKEKEVPQPLAAEKPLGDYFNRPGIGESWERFKRVRTGVPVTPRANEEILLQPCEPALVEKLAELDLTILSGLNLCKMPCTGPAGDALAAIIPQCVNVYEVRFDDIDPKFTAVGPSVLAAIGQLPALRILDLRCCTFAEGASLADIGPHPGLEVLVLDRVMPTGTNGITPAEARGIGGFSDLQYFRIKGKGLGPEFMEELGSCRKLKVLSIYGEGFTVTSADMAPLSNLTGLESLSLSLGVLDDEGLKHLASLTNLVYLSITEHPGITDAGVEHLRGLRKLRRLHMQGTSITDACVEVFNTFPDLVFVNAYRTGVTKSGEEALRFKRPEPPPPYEAPYYLFKEAW